MDHNGGQYQEWTTNGRIGYETTAIYGVPNASDQATITKMAHNWVNWLHNPCHRGASQIKIKDGPQVGGLAT